MWRALSIPFGLIGAFFIFYSVRLLAVTHFLTRVRAGGQGTYIGAVAFPVLALACGIVARRLWRRGAAAGSKPI